MSPRQLRVTGFAEPSRKFARMVRRLDQRMKEELKRVIDELCAGELTPGRNLEQLRLDKSLYSVRLNRNFRFVFRVRENGVGVAIAVGPHNSAYEAAERAQRRK